jgi:polyvinyl alcohol dehydrogenase (cytochrome)
MKGELTSRLPLYVLLLTLTTTIVKSQNTWPSAGQNLSNTRYSKLESTITPENITNLKVKWEFETEGDVSATPAVDEGYVYFPDWKGNLYKVSASTGEVEWSQHFSYYTGIEGDFARTTPAISGNSLIIGTQLNFDDTATLNGAHILNINKNTGELKWIKQVEEFPAAVITQSPVVFGNSIFVGVSSMEESQANSNTYPCCSFRGSVLSLNINTGDINWKTYMTPDSFDFPGVAVWGNTPVVDQKRNSLYVTTGNNYKVPQAVLDCVAAGGEPETVKACIEAVPGSDRNYFDAIVALDLKTGEVKWHNSVIPYDGWNVACLFDNDNCPEEAGPDYDFGQGPALFTVSKNGKRRELLGAGQKSGIYWAFNPDNGDVVWQTQVGPGGIAGGLQWGSAVDEFQVYTAVSNNGYEPHTMTEGPGYGRTVRGGFWASLDAYDGKLLWEVAGENPPAFPPDEAILNPIAPNMGPVSVANGVVFGGAMDAMGTMYAFDAITGNILWSFESGGSVLSGAAISNGSIYWGSGYSNFNFGTPGHKVYAFQAASEEGDVSPLISRTNSSVNAIAQTTPNPFAAVTDIYLQLPLQEHITLMVYDPLGKEIEMLLNEEMKEGEYKISWDSGSLPNGPYVVRIMTPTYSDVKMISKMN